MANLSNSLYVWCIMAIVASVPFSSWYLVCLFIADCFIFVFWSCWLHDKWEQGLYPWQTTLWNDFWSKWILQKHIQSKFLQKMHVRCSCARAKLNGTSPEIVRDCHPSGVSLMCELVTLLEIVWAKPIKNLIQVDISINVLWFVYMLCLLGCRPGRKDRKSVV